jgi:hypothetical protein
MDTAVLVRLALQGPTHDAVVKLWFSTPAAYWGWFHRALGARVSMTARDGQWILEAKP